MNKSDSLGDRMKAFEAISNAKLIPKVPAIIRFDGRSFSNFTKGMSKPWDMGFVATMQDTTVKLCENIQGAIFGYCQSDEISILLIDWQGYDTTKWFDGKIQKICSVGAGIATAYFNDILKGRFENWWGNGVFDARVFNIPEHDIVNNFLWRQQDCERNSVQMLARAHFSHSQCHNKNCNELQDMLMTEKEVNWNDIPTHLKRGTAVVRKPEGWKIDEEMPILSQDRDYINIPRLFENEE